MQKSMIVSQKIVNTYLDNNLVTIKLQHKKQHLEFDSKMIQNSNICLQLERIDYLHKQLNTKKIQLQSMILKQLFRLNTLQYILRPIAIEQTQTQNTESNYQQARMIAQTKFTFNKGRMCKMVRQSQQNKHFGEQYFIIQDSFASKSIYQFIQNICKGIIQLQNLDIYHADINLRNIVFIQQRFMIIDFGEAICFNEGKQFERERQLSLECISIINNLKERREQVKKHKFEQYSFDQYKDLYKEMHSRQFLRLIEADGILRDRNDEEQEENMRKIIKQYIEKMQYDKLIHLCHEKIEDISTERQGNMSYRNKYKLELQVSRENQKPILQNNYNKSEAKDNFGLQLQKPIKNFQYISQQSPILLEQTESKIFSDQLVFNSIKRYNQDMDSCQEPESLQKDGVYFQQQSKQQSCHHQTISKLCLSLKCIEQNNYLLCGCQQGHISRKKNQLKQCHIINNEDFSKLTKSFNEKIKQWGSQNYYLRLIEAFHTSPLSKMEQYYKQIMQSTISQLQSLSKYDEIINKQFLSKNIEQKDMALKLSGLYSFSRFDSKIQFDQFIQFTSNSLEQSLSKIIELAKQQLDILKYRINEALHCNESTNIVKKCLNQKYRTFVDVPQDEGGSVHDLSNSQKFNLSWLPLNHIKQHHLVRIENLTLGSKLQQIIEGQNYNNFKKKLYQLYQDNTQNSNWTIFKQKNIIQKAQKTLQDEYKQQSHMCKTLKFISQNDFQNLKSLKIDLTQTNNNQEYQFSAFDLFHLISKTSINYLVVKGVKIIQFEQFIRVLYKSKHDQSQVNCNVIFDNKHSHSYIQKFNKFQLPTIQIDIQIRFIFKFKDSMEKKKQHLFYFLDHIKQLKSITLTLQFNYQRVQYQSLQLIQKLMQHPIIRGYRLNIHKLQVRQYDNTHNLYRTLQKIQQQSNKIVALQFENVQFGQLERLQTEINTKCFDNIITKILSNRIKQYSVVNCHGFPMINIAKTSLTKLMINNTTFKMKQIDQKQQRNICKTIQSLWIRNSKQLLQRDIHLISFEKLTYLNITLSHHIQEYLVDQQLPLLKTLIISREKYQKVNNQFYRLSKLLHTIQGLEVFNVENILVGSQDIESLKPSALRVLKLSHLNVQNQEILLSKGFNQITELSLSNITFEQQFSKIDLFYQTFDRMQNLRKLKIDKKIMDSYFDIQKLRKKGVFVTINK